MKNKSKFLTFILSFIPGLSHFYLGVFERGAIYLFISAGLIFGPIILQQMFYFGDGPFLLALAGMAVVWLIALLDAFSSLNAMNSRQEEYGSNIEKNLNREKLKRENKRIITLALSIIPGAGHMYLGYQKRGLIFMGAFFFTVFFMGLLNLSFLVFVLPLIWFYSFFDAYHTLNGKEIEDLDISNVLPKINQKYIGGALIVLGILVMFQNMIYPIIRQYLDYRIVSYIQTLIVSLLLILGGIKILKGKKMLEDEEGDIEEYKMMEENIREDMTDEE